MASSKGGGAGKPSKQAQQEDAAPLSAAAYTPVIRDDTPFPVPDLYFKVFDSEADEPDAKIRRDVNKLYERWQQKYGRRWPENGMNTDDLVWLAEEAYKPQLKADERGTTIFRQPSAGELRRGLPAIEEERFPGEFIPEAPEQATPAAPPAGAKGGKKGKKAPAPPRPQTNYEATAAGGNWVTDEFESGDYEAGNLETLWGMHLWDYESKPTMMPAGPPEEAAGEESEDWDDFYGSYRPRFIDTDDAREAVWATDEFESDEDNTESEWEPEYVGAGLGLRAEDPTNPQYSLRHSNHPLAPFPGEPLKWSSYVYDDGTTYEGLTRDAVPHGMGVMIFGNGTGGGFHFRDVRRGDKYEGEFQVGYAHGLGQLTSEGRGEVYVGEFFAGQRHGCGIRINMEPYFYLLARGEEPTAAYQKTHERIMRNIEFRTWYRNRALGSDHEDEVVLHGVRDDLDDPTAVLLRNTRHEAKLRNWAAMDTTDKALLKAVEIIEGVAEDRRWRGGGKLRSHFQVGEDGNVHEILDTENDDTDFDSVELMVGVDSDGGPGLGWVADTEDTDLIPYDAKLQEGILADVAEDKAEESEDKEGILGEDLVNPFTGLTLRDYLDGREGVYKELLSRTGVLDRLLKGGPRPPTSGKRAALARLADKDGSSYVPAELSPDQQLQRALDKELSRGDQENAAELLRISAQLYGEEARASRNPFSEDTDTRFETESDMMELCELAEILGTVDEAREVVTKARMWRWKPDGDVTFRFAQDANGAPLPLMQDPLHYPHGTKFMAPGPAGQCHPIPDDEAIRAEMVRAAQNYAHIYSLYNFDWDPEPGSVQAKIDGRIRRAEELELQSLARMAEAAEAELAAEAAAAAAAAPKKAPRPPKGGAPPAAQPPPPTAPANPQAQLAEAPQQAGTIAGSTANKEVAGSSSGRGLGSGVSPPFAALSMRGAVAPFASLSMGMGTASRVVLDALTRAAKHVPPRRPRVLRPSQLRAPARPRRQEQP